VTLAEASRVFVSDSWASLSFWEIKRYRARVKTTVPITTVSVLINITEKHQPWLSWWFFARAQFTPAYGLACRPN